jgi:hypothetical protein
LILVYKAPLRCTSCNKILKALQQLKRLHVELVKMQEWVRIRNQQIRKNDRSSSKDFNPKQIGALNKKMS